MILKIWYTTGVYKALSISSDDELRKQAIISSLFSKTVVLITALAEHAQDDPNTQSQSRRPDLSSLYTLISEITPDPSQRNRPDAVPVPGDISAAFRHLADALRTMQRDHDSTETDLLQSMIEQLLSTADAPPKEVKGVDEDYIGQLERVPIAKVKSDADCPICGNAFKEDPHPLLVRLPCHNTHVFDLECIRPWLLLNGTCPLDRVDLAKRERERKEARLAEIKKNAAPDDDEEEWDGLYG